MKLKIDAANHEAARNPNTNFTPQEIAKSDPELDSLIVASKEKFHYTTNEMFVPQTME